MKKDKILVAGDIMLDIYCFGKIKRISPEAPVPVLQKEKNSIRYSAGGAANVAANLTAAGKKTTIFSVIGDDNNGKQLLACLKENDIDTELIKCDIERTTTTKLRYIGQNNQQILRVDDERTTEIEFENIEDILYKIKGSTDQYALFLLSDYKKGFLTYKITQFLIKLANKNDIPVLIDVKDINFSKYQNATLLKPNRNELGLITGKNIENFADLVSASCFLCKETSCKYVLTTLGADGMILTDAEGLVKKVSSLAKEVYDVTGAGDTTIAYLARELVNGRSVCQAMEVANHAAGVQVAKVGTSVVYPEELLLQCDDGFNKCLEHDLEQIRQLKKNNKIIVFTNGCFDILHVGHITYLKKASELGDVLVVGVNSDASVQRLKGEKRPVNNLEDRKLILESLEFVDFAIPFEEDTPLDLIKAINPDILVKGGDYQINEIAGADFVQAGGGIVMTIPLVEGKSTTDTIHKLTMHDIS